MKRKFKKISGQEAHETIHLIGGIFFIFIMTFIMSCSKTADPATTDPDEIDNGVPCPGLPTITYEGQVYHTLIIGEQCWLKENLNIGAMINTLDTLQNDSIIQKYGYKNDTANCSMYGGLYTWHEIMEYSADTGSRGICPEGWHIPSDEDWKILEETMDNLIIDSVAGWDTTGWRGSDAGGNLKNMGTKKWYNPNTGAADTKGFRALPGGFRNFEDGSFDKLQSTAFFWTSTAASDSAAWYRMFSYTHADVYRSYSKTTNAFSVRCLKDQ